MSKQLPIKLFFFLKKICCFILLLSTISLSGQPENLTDCEDNYEEILSYPAIHSFLDTLIEPSIPFNGLIVTSDFKSEFGFAYNAQEFFYYLNYKWSIVYTEDEEENSAVIEYFLYAKCENFEFEFICIKLWDEVNFTCQDINENPVNNNISDYNYIPIWNFGEPLPAINNFSEFDLCNPCEKSICIDKELINQSMACTLEIDPVCGCDGKTYSNGCVAEFYFGVKEFTRGACDQSICIDSTNISNDFCTFEYNPVCGCNGVTYPNECSAKNSGVLRFSTGPCSDECVDSSLQNPNGTIYCPLNYTPVCGCNNVTYPNECYALMDGVKDFIYGSCKDINCDSIIYVPLPIPSSSTAQDSCLHLGYNPVCGCDEETYDNPCFAFANGIEYFIMGACDDLICQEENINHDFPCPAVVDPVCGCNGITYGSECEAIRDGIRDWTKGSCDSGECELNSDDLLCNSWLLDLIEKSNEDNFCSTIDGVTCFTEVRKGRYQNQDIIIIHQYCSDGMLINSSETYAYDCTGKLIDHCSSFSLAIWYDHTLANGIIINNLINEEIIWDCNDGLPNCNDPCVVPNSYLGNTDNITEISARLKVDQINYNLYDWRYKLKSQNEWIDLDSTLFNLIDITKLIRCESYVWQFRVKCESGLWSEWLGNYCFETTCLLEPCYLPTNYEIDEELKTQTSIRLTFSPVNYLKYQWRIKLKTSSNWLAVNESDINTIDIFGLSSCTEYSFQIKVQCMDEQWSEWITEYCFQTECPEPCQIPLNYNLTNSLQTQTSVRISFTPDNYSKYDWRYRKAGAPIWIELNPSVENYVDLFSLKICQDYELEVRLDCGNSNWTDWIGDHTFSTQCTTAPCEAPANFEFENDIIANNAMRVIFSPSDYYAYDWRYKSKNANSWEPVLQTTGNFIDLSDLDDCTEYLLEIKVACDPDSWSEWFGENCFTTFCSPLLCEIPDNYSLDTALTTETSIQIIFDLDLYEYYDWRYRPTNQSSWIEWDSTSNASLDLFGLTSCEEYELQLSVWCNEDNWSPWFGEYIFNTLCPIIPCEAMATFLMESNLENDNSITLSVGLNDFEFYDWRIKLQSEIDWLDLDSTTNNLINLDGLIDCETYEWEFRVACGVSDWSQWYEGASFTSYCPEICEEPIGRQLGMSLLTQSSVRLEFAPANYFSYLWRFRTNGGIWIESDTTILSFIDLTLLDPCQEYQWQVKISCGVNDWSEWFGFEEFMTECPPPVCELDFAYGLFQDEIEENAAQLNIDNFNFSNYRWQFKKEDDFDWIYIGESNENKILISDLENCTAYVWQVSIQCDSQEWSEWFGFGLFKTECPEEICVANSGIVYYTKNPSTQTVSFEVTNANFEAYLWRIKKAGTNDWNLLDTTFVNSIDLVDLESCQPYTWQVKFKCANGIWSNWNGINDFETLCEMEDCTIPQNYAFTTSELNPISFEFKIDNFTYDFYDWRYKDDNSSIWIDLDSTANNSFVISNLDTCAVYKWQSRVSCSLGKWSEWFGDENFLTPCPDTKCFVNNGFFLTEDNLTATSVTLVSDIPNQLQYQFEYKLRSDLQYTRTDSLSLGTFELSNLESCNFYDWRVRVQCTNGTWSDWKGVANFKTECISANAENDLSKITVYPNPSFGLITIKSEAKIDKIQVFDLQGNLHKESNTLNQINLNECAAGIYLLNVLVDEKWRVFKVVKM